MVEIIPPTDEYREKLMATRRNPKGMKAITAPEVELAARLDLIRRSQGVTLQDMADHLGVHVNQTSKYMRGQNKIPISRFVALCAYLSVAPGEMLWGLDDVKTPDLRESPKRMLSLAQMFNSIPDQVTRDALYTMVVRVYSGEVRL